MYSVSICIILALRSYLPPSRLRTDDFFSFPSLLLLLSLPLSHLAMHLSSMMLSSFSILAVAITNVAAHGYVSSVTNSTGAKFETLNVWIGDEKYQSKPAVSR